MVESFRTRKNIVGIQIVDNRKGEDLKEAIFPHGTNLDFINNTIIADYSKRKKNYKYKVMSYIDGERVRYFECSEVKRLANDNLKLTLKGDYEGVYRSLIFDTTLGKAVSDVFDGMSDLQDDGTFIARLRVDKRRGNFDYIMKIDTKGQVVSDVLNDYTGEIIQYDDIIFDENKTFNLMEERARVNFIKGYSLEKKYNS